MRANELNCVTLKVETLFSCCKQLNFCCLLICFGHIWHCIITQLHWYIPCYRSSKIYWCDFEFCKCWIFCVFPQSSITMGTVPQVATTLQMSSTSVWTAGCALMTRRWRSSISIRWWSRLQSALPTCCTTVMWTCCRNHTRTHKHTRVHLNTCLHSDTHTISHTHNHVSQQKHCPTSRLSFSHQPCYSREPAFPTFCSFCLLFWKRKRHQTYQKTFL